MSGRPIKRTLRDHVLGFGDLVGVEEATHRLLGVESATDGAPSAPSAAPCRHWPARASSPRTVPGSVPWVSMGRVRFNLNVTIPRDPCADSTGHHRTERPENVDPPRHDL